jgi:2-C-methyl-D-erythritol 4-phosphate cytidylyltransferase / 2-C-methyl-D-erythritol 2,4-cyclodiphosphate synthase
LSGVGPAADPAREAASPRVDVVVVAAGTSSRMGGIDKLDAPLGGRPLLARTLAALASAPVVERIVIVTAEDRVEALRSRPWLPSIVTAVVPGGARRQESVAAGLAALDPDGRGDDQRVVLIHDGARPLVSPELVERVARGAVAHGAAVPVLPVAETVKRIAGDVVLETVDRADLATAQTPQGFRRGVLRVAHAERDPFGSLEWTDEAALCESCTIEVHVVPGEPSNLKVTLPADLARAEAYFASPTAPRIGLGHDSHPFGPGSPLALGGIDVPGAPRLHGHSDGDVALHALADALLGAAGLGDLGRIFPAGPATPRGIASRELVADVIDRVAAAGYRPASADLLIVAARPRLSGHLASMRDAIAALLRLPVEAVNVKASTGNLSGDEGAGRGISAQAIAVVEAMP